MKKLLTLAQVVTKWLENVFQFVAIVVLVYLLLYTLFMIFSLGGSSGFNFFKPAAQVVMSISVIIWGGNTTGIFQAWEFITGVFLITGLFLILQFLKQRFSVLSKFFADLKIQYLKDEERKINKELRRDIEKMNKNISACFIYVELKEKEHIHEKVDIEEQYKLLNQFLYSKTSAIPEKNGYGYIYKFSNIEKIDTHLQYFFKAIHSQAPINYMFILQVVETSFGDALLEVSKLRNSGVYNKILMTPTTHLRYENNLVKTYSTGVVGDYVFEGMAHSIYELREKFF